MKLYYTPKTRSSRVRWLLEELGVPYEIQPVSLKDGDQRKPEFLKINPYGAVPALEDGNTRIFESGAICTYLADKYLDKKLAPPVNSPERAAYLQWVFFAVATLEVPLIQIHLHTRRLPEEKRAPVVVTESKAGFERCAGVLSKALEGKRFLLGDPFTVADVLVGSMVEFAKALQLLDGYPVLLEYLKRLTERPAFQKSRQD